MRQIKHIALLLLTVTCLTASAGNTENARAAFERGTEAYKNGEYLEALAYFKEAETDTEGFAINYNLGNTCYKLNKIPESILYLERALKFDPANEDARYNLRLANERIADRIESLPKTKLALWWEDFRFGMGPDGWAYITVILSIAAALFFFLFAFGKNSGLRRFGFFTGLICVFLLIAGITLSSSAEAFRYTPFSAVIFTDKVDVKSEPRRESTEVFVLHAGTRVSLLRSEGDWYHIEIASGNRGWIKEEDLRKI